MFNFMRHIRISASANYSRAIIYASKLQNFETLMTCLLQGILFEDRDSMCMKFIFNHYLLGYLTCVGTYMADLNSFSRPWNIWPRPRLKHRRFDRGRPAIERAVQQYIYWYRLTSVYWKYTLRDASLTIFKFSFTCLFSDNLETLMT